MKRRSFLQSSALLAGTTLLPAISTAAPENAVQICLKSSETLISTIYIIQRSIMPDSILPEAMPSLLAEKYVP